ncbi:hypothetical protein A6395_00765 [Exiguobacterium sp. SH31]|uniref:hypothetical protein n=2 Tax=unclassified Exiguobacterium TaxID=2644629 RepID=UPI0008C8934A|nr:hypothetical protein [Exiguobacterium sp. SH31]OGX80602.1 hypothetical protein A6395_00765 [Exiguobacterium sp. SH31]
MKEVIKLAQLIAAWFVGFMCVLSTFVYVSKWRSERKLMKLLGSVFSVFIAVVCFMIAVPDTYDRAFDRYETASGNCYVVDNQSKQGGVTLWFEEESYDFPEIPEDVAYGPGTLFACNVTLTKVNSTGVDYMLKSEDGKTLFSTY